MLKWSLIPLGLLTAVVMAGPQLVIVGLIFLIIPGLILILVPTLFVYLSATCLLRVALPLKSEVGAHLAAFVLAIGLSAAVMYPYRASEQRAFAHAALPDILPAGRLTITGDILVNWPEPRSQRNSDGVCDYLCTALLDTPGVTSVTRSSETGAATFRRGANQPGTLVMPHEPHAILAKFRRLSQERKPLGLDALQQADRALQADWALRIVRGDELRRDRPIEPADVDWTITLERRHVKGQPQVDRLEIRDKSGQVQVRTSLVRSFVPAPLFYFGFEGGSSADGFGGARFTVGGSTVSNQPRYYDFDGAVELLRLVDIPRPAPQPDVVERMEAMLLEVLDNPNATPTQLLIAPMWLRQFKYDAKAGQLDTIARILLDERIADPAESLRTALSSGTDLTPLREGLVRRYHSAADSKSRSWYIASLVSVADGAFAEPTDAERAIWSEALSSDEAAPFVERMADQGAAAVPELLALVDASLKKPWHARWRLLAGVREAFKRLGPEAAAAAPTIQSLIEKSPSTLLNTSGDRSQWLVALRLMGVAAKDLPLGIHQLKPEKAASEIQRIEQQVERYREERRARR